MENDSCPEVEDLRGFIQVKDVVYSKTITGFGPGHFSILKQVSKTDEKGRICATGYADCENLLFAYLNSLDGKYTYWIHPRKIVESKRKFRQS